MYACLLGLVCHSIFLCVFLAIGETYLSTANIMSVMLFIVCLLLARRGHLILASSLGFAEVALHAYIATTRLGWASSFQLYLFGLVALWFLLAGIPWMVRGACALAVALIYGALHASAGTASGSSTVEPEVIMWLARLNIANFTLLLVVVCGYYAYAVSKARKALAEELERSEHLLHNILPVSIATRLKASETLIADSFDSCSVLFADIVGFTPLSATMTAQELVAMLNEIFSGFDSAVTTHGLEKIKTIGDAYMAAAGIPEPCDDHAERVAKMALDMRDFVAAYRERTGLDINIRIGLHSGEAVAGVIGKHKFIYDLWGDTVNIASRMESHGAAGEVHMSAATYALLRGQFDITDRGIQTVKGKGEMHTYFLTGPLPAERKS
jgi:adenylate cyclase